MRKEDFIKVCEIILDELKARLPDELDLEKDFYWDVSEVDMYSSSKKSHELMVYLGQHSDDWQDLSELLDNPEEAMSYDLIRLSALLKGIKQLGDW